MTSAQQPQDAHDPQDAVAPGVVRRPGTVTAGAILAWIASAFLVSIGAAAVIRAAAADSRSLMAAMSWTVTLTGVIVIAAGLLGLLLTTLAFRGSRGSLIALTVLGALCVAVPIASVVYLLTVAEAAVSLPSIRALLCVVWTGAAIGLLWSGHSWFRAQRRT